MKKKSFIENAGAAIFWTDAETGLLINCNEAAETLLEKKKEEIIGRPQTILHPPGRADYYANLFKAHIEENGAVDHEVEVITASGKIKLIRATAILTLVGNRPVIQGVFHNITDRKRWEKILQASETRFRRLFETARDGILILDAETGAITEVNPFLVEMLGHSRQDFLGKKLWEIGFFKDIEASKVAFKELQDKEYIRYEDLPLKTKDGRLIDVEFVSNVYWVDHQKVIQCNIRNISGRKRLEEVLQASETRFRRLFETARDGILILDAGTGAITEVNPFLAEMMGYAREDFLGKKLWEIGFFKDIEASKVAFKELQDKEYIRYEDLPLETKDGCHIDVEFVSNVYWVDHQKVIQCNVRDISERKTMERALKASEERFRYMSFHDYMTGLYNRGYFAEEMARLGNDLSRSAPVSIISIDVDGLKLVNDTFGHKAGDELLITVSRLIATPFRKIDVIARVGGDEFCVVLPRTSFEAGLAKKSEIAKLVTDHNNKNPAMPIHLSIGVATSQSSEKENIYDVYRRADENMYEFKLMQPGSLQSKVVDMLSAALAERDFIANGHVERLLRIAERMAEGLHLSDDQRRNLLLLAKVHDLGKIGIPDKILFKSGKLSEEEYAIMQTHSRIGYNIANRSKELFHIASLVLHHHEFWDGSGYADKLMGEQIPLECRIFSIIDAYDAMTNTRPYHAGISKQEAIKELRRCSGTQFEPGLVDQFVAFLEPA